MMVPRPIQPMPQPQQPAAQMPVPMQPQPQQWQPRLLPTQKTAPKVNTTQYNWLVYGPPKVGKTTFAAMFDDPLILSFGVGEEPKHIECYYLMIQQYEQFEAVYGEMAQAKQAGQLQFKTVVLDTIDGAVALIQDRVCREDSPPNGPIKPLNQVLGGYGQGHKAANKRLIDILSGFVNLGLNVVLLSHTREAEVTKHNITNHVTTFTLPNSAAEAVTKWVDIIGYADYNPNDSNQRLITFKGTRYCNAGARLRPGVVLPEVLPLDYHEIKRCFEGLPLQMAVITEDKQEG